MEIITIKKTVKVDREINETLQVPAYFKDNCHWYKIISEDTCLKVTFSKFIPTHTSIEYINPTSALECKESDSDKAEFEEMYAIALEQLNNHLSI